jgi:hypothetical protein
MRNVKYVGGPERLEFRRRVAGGAREVGLGIDRRDRRSRASRCASRHDVGARARAGAAWRSAR